MAVLSFFFTGSLLLYISTWSIPIHGASSEKLYADQNYTFPYTASLREGFEKSFRDRCEKYKFVSKWVQRLEDPGEKYLTFVYQVPGVKNGGLGDRIGGLISAIAIALRHNRQLLIRSSNGIEKVFRPYHPTFSAFSTSASYSYPGTTVVNISAAQDAMRKFRWINYENWTLYDPHLANNDATEYDIYQCINNVGNYELCGLTGRDVEQPLILYRSNRAYLCLYDKHTEFYAHKEMHRIGVWDGDDLYEVAGCMMRLALWPTERLWRMVDRLYSDSVNEPTKEDVKQYPSGLFQVGMHFRCGDRSYLMGGGFDHMCVWDPAKESKYPSDFMRTGNPYMAGICAHNSYQRLLNFAKLGDVGEVLSDDSAVLREEGMPAAALTEEQLVSIFNSSAVDLERKLVLGFVASDNSAAAGQLAELSSLKHLLLPPAGCHIEMDPSTACHLMTVTQWFALSMSDILVTQTLSSGAATSSFSRYAGIYSLKRQPFRDSRECGRIYDPISLSRRTQSNWFC